MPDPALPFDPLRARELPKPKADYIGLVLPDGYRLTEGDVLHLKGLEVGNRRRVRKKGDDAIVEKVDFISICIEQAWRCYICHNPMRMGKKIPRAFRISVEHDPAVSVCREHTKRTVKGAHAICNFRKGRQTDTTRAAKIKRVQKDEDRHATRMRAKANLSRDAYRKLKQDEAKLQSRGKRKLASRGFDKRLRKRMNGTVEARNG